MDPTFWDDAVSQSLVADVTAKLAARRAKRGSAEQVFEARATPLFSSYIEAAAVLAWYEPETINPVDKNFDDRARDELLVASVRITDADGIPRWALSPDKRVEALHQLRSTGLLQTALAANKAPDDKLQRMLTAFLTNSPPILETQSLEDLSLTYQVCGWLSAAGFANLPSAERITLRTDWLSLLQPFQHLAGEGFRGRKAELATLRKYVGVLPPSSALESVQRAVENFFNFTSKHPLLVFGPGGVGKSALIARFILEHAQAHAKDHFPFIYLDFDRPAITARQPLSLLSEAVRQIGIEYPHAREACELVRRQWLDDIAKAEHRSADRSKFTNANDTSDTTGAAIRDFAKLIDTLGAAERPVVLILDTFEEVQWSSTVLVENVWEFLERLQALVPRLRVIFVGRGEIANTKTDNLALTGLDEEAAVGFLQHRGIADAEVARRIVKQVGGSPLSLKLAAEIASKNGLYRDGNLQIATHEYLFFKLDSEVIQRQLYRRILGHIHDENVAKLAHPGLVLRRITPDLIAQVLMQPCGIPDDVSSSDLFEELKREVALVQTDGADAIRHRDELRRLILKLIYDDEPDRARIINQKAVAWYSDRRFDPRERAEEIYHRLMLDQDFKDIDARWELSVERFLKNAMWEFTGRRKGYLARRLNVAVDRETSQSAALEDWERLVAPQAMGLLTKENFDEALKLIRERRERTAASPLFTLEAQALARGGNPHEAIYVLENGFSLAATDGQSRQALSLALQSSEIAYSFDLEADAIRCIDHLEGFGEEFGSPIDRLNIATRRVALTTLDPGAETYLIELRGKMMDVFNALTDADLRVHPIPSYWCGAMLGSSDDIAASSKVLARIFAVTGLPRGARSEIRRLAAEIATFDATRPGAPAGTLAQTFGAPVSETLTQSWTQFLLDSPEAVAASAASKVLSIEPAAPSLVDAAISLLRTALGIQRATVQQPALATRPRKNLKAAGREQESLVDALTDTFGYEELRQIVRFRLNRSLEVISIGAGPLRTIVFDLVSTAEREGWLGELVAGLLDARPNDISLSRAAENLGISTLTSQGASLERVISDDGLMHPDATASRLAEIQGRVCRIEIAGRAIAIGFLVDKDTILTANRWVDAQDFDKIDLATVTIRFDYRVTNEGKIISEGTVFALEKYWLVARNVRLDYALLRLRNSPGISPVGSGVATLGLESVAIGRGWFDLSQPAPKPDRGAPLFTLQYRETGSLLMTVGELVSFDDGDLQFTYSANTLDGSSGAPIMSSRLELIGMNLGSASMSLNFGTLMSAIVEDLRSNAVLNRMTPRLA